MEGIFLKPIQRLQKYPLFFKVSAYTPLDDPYVLDPLGFYSSLTTLTIQLIIGLDEPNAKGGPGLRATGTRS
jgi:hypothetical protein